jgi:hypothetical protein
MPTETLIQCRAGFVLMKSNRTDAFIKLPNRHWRDGKLFRIFSNQIPRIQPKLLRRLRDGYFTGHSVDISIRELRELAKLRESRRGTVSSH